MELNENDNNDQNLNINQELEKNKSIFVSGIPYLTSEIDLKKIFEECGKIKSMKLPKYQDTGRNIGYAHILFFKNKDAEKVRVIIILYRLFKVIFYIFIVFNFFTKITVFI